MRVASDGHPYAGDRAALATIGGPGRRSARLHFTLNRRANVTLEVLQTGQGAVSERPVPVAAAALSENETMFGPGSHTLEWAPPANLPPRTYILRLTATSTGGRSQTEKTVVRLLGVDAAFAKRSVRPGDRVTLVTRTDARSLSAQWLHSGPETEANYANDVIKGIAMGAPVAVNWSGKASAPAPIALQVAPDWPSGVYFAQLTADDGRVGYAPLIVRPAKPQARVAVVLPTTTWGAYNFHDADGDGWGDTWYARWKTNRADLTRPNPNRGVPYRYRSYDLAFQHWLARTGKNVDFYADEDLEAFAGPAALRAAYDLIVFPGHTEYVTSRLYDLIEGYRNAGGNLMFLLGQQLLPPGRPARPRGRADRRMARPGSSRVRAPRRAVRRRRPRPAARGVHRHRSRGRTVGIRGYRARERQHVRPLRHRGRPARGRVTAGTAGAGGDPQPVRPRPLGDDDVLRAHEWRAGVQRGRARLRRPGAALAADDAAARERLGRAWRLVNAGGKSCGGDSDGNAAVPGRRSRLPPARHALD